MIKLNKEDPQVSKKLLEAVFSKEIDGFNFYKQRREARNFYQIFFKDKKFISINIYELAHKCKEWALELEYIIESYYEAYYDDNKPYAIVKVFFDGNEVWNNYSNEYIDIWHTEPESIFKACEWILKQKELL